MIRSSASAEAWITLSERRCSMSRSVCESTSIIPVTPIIGVRISWLIAARNALLAWLASRARASLSRNARSRRLSVVRSVATASSPTIAPVSSRIADNASNTGRVRPRWWRRTNSRGGSRCWASARNAVQSGAMRCP